MPEDKPLLIVSRAGSYRLHLDDGEVVTRFYKIPHYEVHFADRVEFWSRDMKEKLGESGVEVVA